MENAHQNPPFPFFEETLGQLGQLGRRDRRDTGQDESALGAWAVGRAGANLV